MASEAVAQPGRNGTGACEAALASAGGAPGLTRNLAPAATAWVICSTETIVPAPTTASGTFFAMAWIAASAEGVRKRHFDRVKTAGHERLCLGQPILDARDL